MDNGASSYRRYLDGDDSGFLEIIIAPDNTCFNPMGYDISQYFKGILKPYEIFYHGAAAFVP